MLRGYRSRSRSTGRSRRASSSPRRGTTCRATSGATTPNSPTTTPVPEGAKWATGHAMDLEAKAVRMGWMPFVPQFKESSLEVAREAEAAGATDAKAVAAHVAGRLKSKDLELAVDDPDDPENWPRSWLDLARQRDHGERQGPRVLPAPLPRHPRQQRRRGEREGQGQEWIVNMNALRHRPPPAWPPSP